MPQITEGQKRTIKILLEHTPYSTALIAKKVGIKVQRVYYWGHKLMGEHFMMERGKVLRPRGERHFRYGDGTTTDKDGYRLITAPDWWRGTLDRVYAYEHHVVWCEVNGLDRVPPNTVIHHIDCNHRNNAPDNLIAMTPKAHRYLHRTLKVCEADRR